MLLHGHVQRPTWQIRSLTCQAQSPSETSICCAINTGVSDSHFERENVKETIDQMITPEAIIALKAYTAMSKPIQGILEKYRTGFSLAGEVKTGGDLLKAISDTTATVYCIRYATFHASVTDPGSSQSGPFTFRGIATRAREGKITLLGRLLEGSIGDDVRRALEANGVVGATATYLVTFTEHDVLKCSGRQQIAFGTSTTAEGLAPKWEHIAPVLTGQLPRTIAACANGCYTIELFQTEPRPDFPLEKSRALLNNLSKIDLVATTKPAPSEGGVIYRLATNALIVAPAAYEDQIAEIQRTLRLPQIRKREKLPATTALDISASVADIGDEYHPHTTVTARQLSEVAPLTVYSQPFERWQLPARLLTIHVRAHEHTKVSPIRLTPWLERGSQLGIEMTLTIPKLRPVRPGETLHSQREQLERIARSVTNATLATAPVGKSQTALNEMTSKLAAALQTAIGRSGLFENPPRLLAHVLFNMTRGEPVRLPNGSIVVVPVYAVVDSSPRLCAITGALAALGLRVSFYSWKQAKQGIALQ